MIEDLKSKIAASFMVKNEYGVGVSIFRIASDFNIKPSLVIKLYEQYRSEKHGKLSQ